MVLRVASSPEATCSIYLLDSYLRPKSRFFPPSNASYNWSFVVGVEEIKQASSIKQQAARAGETPTPLQKEETERNPHGTA